MKIWFLALIVSVLLAIGAIYLALNKIDGWGWFLFGAIVTFVYPSSKSGDKEEVS